MISWRPLFIGLIGIITSVRSCGYPGSPSHSVVTFSSEVIQPGTVAAYDCEPGFELLGPSRRICSGNNTWTPAGIPFCVLNVAAGKAPMQSSVAQGGIAEKAVDGSTSSFFSPETCSLTENERAPWWYVNLLEPFLVQLVRLDFGKPCCGNNKPATIVVRVGNSRPDLTANPICNRFTGFIEEGRPLFLPCNPPMPGAFVSIHLEGSPGNSLSICEAFVYTDQALPIERCPQFRDQEPGSTSTYNGKCYTFHSNHALSFHEARQFCEARGGSLIDETNPALQGFISWELWRRHGRNDPSGQYWMGVVRDRDERNSWRWLSGKEVTISFWNLPGTNEDCARYDGTKGWLWSDTNCNLRLFFICQHRPKSCGRPEQPANGSLVTENFLVGSRIEYRCNSGHMIVGPSVRTCLPTGFYTEYPPVCKHVQCGLPARIPNGSYKLVNNSRDYLNMVSYTCTEGYQLIGRGDLICDIDGRWNGPPPRCEPVYCLEPPHIYNGGFRLSTNSTIAGTIVEYYCLSQRFKLSGPATITCNTDGHYDKDPPVCIANDVDTSPVDRFDIETEYDDDDYVEEAETTSHRVPSSTIKSSRPPSSSSSSSTTSSSSSASSSTIETTRRQSTTSSTTIRPKTVPTSSIVPRKPILAGNSTLKPSHNNTASDTVHPVYLPPQDNEIADSANVKNNVPPNVNEPRNKIESGYPGSSSDSTGKLNLGGIIALGVFGGFVFLAAIITTFVIVIRRIRNDKRYRRRSVSNDNPPAANFDSSSGEERAGGLNKYYRQAWDNLREHNHKSKSHPRHDTDKGHHHHHHTAASRKETLDDPNYRTRMSEGVRDEGEMVVTDVYPKSSRSEEKKRHHHHHHHKHSKHSSNGAAVW